MKNTWAHPILDCTQSALHEESILSNDVQKIRQAMLSVGKKCAHEILKDFGELCTLNSEYRLKVAIMVGKGHNGGDALVAALEILKRHNKTDLFLVFPFGKSELKPLTQEALESLNNNYQELTIDELNANKWDIAIDGLVGLAFKGDLRDPAKRWIDAFNEHSDIRMRAAIDMPSGLVFRADFSYSAGTFKKELLDCPQAGRMRYLDIGFFSGSSDVTHYEGNRDWIVTPEVLSPLKTLRAAKSDKRTFGHVGILAGSEAFPGAAILAAMSALKSGAGLVTVFCNQSVYDLGAPELPEAIWVNRETTELKEMLGLLERCDSLVAGPGLGEGPEAEKILLNFIQHFHGKLVLDASALQPATVSAIAKDRAFILTPHDGEFARIESELNHPEAIVLRKSYPSHVCYKKRRYFCVSGGPILARGGSGDLLSGIMGTLWAQHDDPLYASCAATSWLSTAADLAARAHGQTAFRTSQLTDFLGPALRQE